MNTITACHSEIHAISGYLPSNVVKSQELMNSFDCQRFGVDQDYILVNMGIEESRQANMNELPSDLAVRACQNLFDEYPDTNPSMIDTIIYCGIDRDFAEPSTAHEIARKLGINAKTIFDVSNACHGFLDAMKIGDAFISNNMSTNVLITAGETPSKIMSIASDQLKKTNSIAKFKKTIGCFTMGDNGSAMILRKKQKHGMIISNHSANGAFANLCYYSKNNNGVDGQMIMAPLLANVLKMHKDMLPMSLTWSKWETKDIDLLITHQVGEAFFQKLSKIFSIPESKMSKTYPSLGNLITGTIPINLWVNKEQLNGKKVFIAGAGSGISISQWAIHF